MLVPTLILLTGLLLVYLEFFLPGGVMGTVGGILLIISVVVFAGSSGSPLQAIAFAVLSIVALVLVVRVALWRIRQASPGHSVYLAADQAGYVASSFDESALEKEGIVLSDLKPSGHILVDGQRYQALSQGSYVKKGSAIRVLSGKGAYLVVKPLKKEEEL